MPTPAATAVWEMCVWGGKAVTFCCDDQEASSRSMHAQATIGASVCKASNVHLCNVRRSAMPLCISVNAGEWVCKEDNSTAGGWWRWRQPAVSYLCALPMSSAGSSKLYVKGDASA